MSIFDTDPFRRRDPFAGIDRALGMGPGSTGGGIRQERPEYRRPLPEGEQASLGKQILDTASGGLSQVFGALDKPGQAVRGLIAGKGVGSLKHLIPFSGNLGLTRPEEYTSGRDITNQIGLTSKSDKGWGSWGTGLAADILTDPLTYVTFGAKGALTGTGRALEKAGQLKGFTREGLLKGFETTAPKLSAAGKSASDIAYEAAKGTRIASPEAVSLGARPGEALSGLARVSVPFFPKAGVTLGTGRAAQAAARGMDVAEDYLRYGNPVGRQLGALFNADVGRATSGPVQKGMAEHFTPALKALQAEGRGQSYDVLAGLDPLIRGKQFPEREITGAVRSLAERAPSQIAPELARAAAPVAETVRSIGERSLEAAKEAGADIKDLQDPFAQYVHRQAIGKSEAAGGVKGKSKVFTGKTAVDMKRQEVLRNVPGGTEYLNTLPGRFAGSKDIKGIAGTIRQELQSNFERGGYDPAMTISAKRGGELIEMPAGEYLDRKARQLAKYVSGMEPGSSGIFSPNIAEDIQRHGEMAARKVAAARGAIGTIGDVARPLQAGDVPVPRLLKDLGLKTYAESGKPVQGALVQAQRALAKQGAADVAPMVSGDLKAIHREVGRFGVPESIANEMRKSMQGWATPEELVGPQNLWSQATNLYKALLYPIWPASHIRNVTSAAINNLRSGVRPLDYATQARILRGTVSPEQLARYGFRNLDEARRAQYATANILGGHSLGEDVANVATTTAAQPGRFTPIVPGTERAGKYGLLGDIAGLVGRGTGGTVAAAGRGAVGGVRNLFDRSRGWGQSLGERLAIQGVGGAEKDVLPAVLAGRVAGTNIEDMVRGAQWLAEVRKGATPAQAAEVVNRTHFDYSRLTPFERNVIKPIAPFYTYSKFNLPFMAQTALTRPGIISSQLRPFEQDQGGYVPDYLKGGVAIPIGPEVGGQRQYLSSLGLPVEEAFGRFHFKGGLPDFRQTAMDYLGMLHPVPKSILEQLADTQFYSGRRLSDLRSPESARAIGRLFGEENPQLLSQLMVNTPASRFVTSLDKLIDPRKSWWQKALNLGTGARVSDVDVEKARAVELRNRLEDMLKGQPHLSRYQRFYVKPEDAASLTPDQVELMRLYSGIQDQALAAAKQRRAGGG